MLIGGTLGVLIMALCHVSGRESDREEYGVPVTLENVGKRSVNITISENEDRK